MGTQDWSKDVIFLNLPRKLWKNDELQRVIEMVRERGDCNVVVDFSSVDVVGCSTLSRLLELQQLLQDIGHKLILCGVAQAKRGVFIIARFDDVFDFIKDKFATLACPQIIGGRRHT